MRYSERMNNGRGATGARPESSMGFVEGNRSETGTMVIQRRITEIELAVCGKWVRDIVGSLESRSLTTFEFFERSCH